jgi:hypothetical protein
MTENEFIGVIESGGAIMFDCNGKHYTLLIWTDEPIYIAEQKTEENEAKFETIEDLVEHYMIGGKPLKERVNEIKITFRT